MQDALAQMTTSKVESAEQASAIGERAKALEAKAAELEALLDEKESALAAAAAATEDAGKVATQLQSEMAASQSNSAEKVRVVASWLTYCTVLRICLLANVLHSTVLVGVLGPNAVCAGFGLPRLPCCPLCGVLARMP